MVGLARRGRRQRRRLLGGGGRALRARGRLALRCDARQLCLLAAGRSATSSVLW